MANERTTDFFIGKLLGDSNIEFTPNGSNIKEIQNALKSASKRGTGKAGFPEFVCKSKDFILVVEDKPDTDKQASYTNDEKTLLSEDSKSIADYAENGALHYAKHKSKKTFNVSAIVAAALMNGTVLQYDAELPENKRKILYVDTEQSPYHCQKVMRRIVRMAGLPLNEEPRNLEFLSLRRHTPEVRIAIVKNAIYHTENLGLVIIDGIRDMVYDINSPSESTKIISKLMQWTDERQIHIHTILHQNKADENARGHIGTELNNKAETVLEVAKDKFDSDISTVQAIHIRAMDFQPFAFRINDDALLELVGDYAFENKKSNSKHFNYSELKEEQHRQALEATFSEVEAYGFKDLIEALRKGYATIGCEYGENKVGKLKIFLENKRMIIKDSARKYSYNPQFNY